MSKDYNTFFRIYEEKKKNTDLSNILDVPILLFEEQGPEGYCYTDLEAAKQFYRDMYTEDLSYDHESLTYILEFINKQTLESFARSRNYKEFGYSKYLDSIRSTIMKYFNTIKIDPDNITYDEESKMILVPVNTPQYGLKDFVKDIKDEYIFGTETCIGDPSGFKYDSEKELITIPADFSNLNAEYPKG